MEDLNKILAELDSGQAQLIDVREANEWTRGRFKCAIHAPLSQLANGVGVDVLRDISNANKKIYLHCFSDARVQSAKRLLARYDCADFEIIPASMRQMIANGFELVEK